MLPKDPFMLLSAVNMKLRDTEQSLDELCEDEETSSEEVKATLLKIGYRYDEGRRTFAPM